jgi:hypothetical protein
LGFGVSGTTKTSGHTSASGAAFPAVASPTCAVVLNTRSFVPTASAFPAWTLLRHLPPERPPTRKPVSHSTNTARSPARAAWMPNIPATTSDAAQRANTHGRRFLMAAERSGFISELPSFKQGNT